MSGAPGADEPGARDDRPLVSDMGVPIALSIILLWALHLAWSLFFVPIPVGVTVPHPMLAWVRVAIHLLIQTYLYTGLFITAHDAMHGSISCNRPLNQTLGRIASFLYAAFSYSRLQRNHMKHHRWPGEARDPDFCVRSQNAVVWFVTFFLHYVTLFQLLIMTGLFNLLSWAAGTWNVVLFWVVPALLSTFQLFYFGTFRPHRYPHTEEMQPHNARSQRRNHVWAMLSCYFFGYHHEHHTTPRVPWWRLYREKDRM
jgi:beta-carotene/zeaxanthin 4-ketolase